MRKSNIALSIALREHWADLLKACALVALLLVLSAPLSPARAQDGPLISAPPKQAPGPAAKTASAEHPAAPASETANAVVSQPPAARPPAASSTGGDTRYRIGPGDVLEIRVLKAPELSREAVRVDQRGMIRIPMMDEDVQAACYTEGELSQRIAAIYLKYKKHPHVDVFVKEFQSQPVAVVGAVNSPGQFKLQRQIRLLDLLTYAGGAAERAGQTVQIVHSGEPSVCERPAGEMASSAASDSVAASVVTFNLSDTLLGQDRANPFIRPGDIISVLAADQVYVIGNVVKPMAIALKEPTTISRAIAMAGGFGPDGKKSRVHIVRQSAGGGPKSDFYVDLGAISKHKAEDVALQANDIIEVPTSMPKNIMHSLLGVIAPTAAQGAARVIP